MKLTIKELVLFGMMGALMFASKVMMEFLPNIHLVGVFIIALTVVYRQKALYPIYIFVLLGGLLAGFNTWWIPYLYVWAVLWGIVMLLPKNLPPTWQPPVYMTVCGLHGLLFGVLCAPVQAALFHLDINGTVAWILAGVPFDILHAIGNLVGGLLICPIIALLRNTEKYTR